MAVNEAMSKVAIAVKLNNGTTASGAVSTLTVNLGSLNTAAFSDNVTTANQKAMNIVALLGACTAKPVYTVQKVVTSTLVQSS